MSSTVEEECKRWTAKPQAKRVFDIFRDLMRARFYEQFMPVVRHPQQQGLLPFIPHCSQGAVALCRVYRSHDQRESILWLPNGGALTQHQQEYSQRIFQPEGVQVKKRPLSFRPQIEALPSVAMLPNQRRSTDLCQGSGVLGLVTDCYIPDDWYLSRCSWLLLFI